jgi:pimeloyl-ACP methyl ester carboxylesterase
VVTVVAVTDADRNDADTGEAPVARSVLRLLTAVPGRRDDAVAIVNGLFGDTFDERRSRLATPMTIRAGDTILPLDREALAAALAATATPISPRICVMVHGLMSTESIWRIPDSARPDAPSPTGARPPITYGTLLSADHDVTVLSLRYNTGRHISTNGRQLAHLLNQLVRAWPVRVREINLVGHSMGGLVIRSACHYAGTIRPLGRRLPLGRRWTSTVRRVVLIGVPNTGAGLEVFVNSASAALWAIPGPATRLIGRGLDRRSAGIKDLRFGAILDDDWLEADPGSRHRTHPHRQLRLRRARYLVIAGTVTSDPEHPIARRIGDALVTESSANGLAGDGELFPGATTRLFPKVTHNALAHHPDVYEAIAGWW